MKRSIWIVGACLLVAAWFAFSSPPAAQAQIGGMTCIECHGDPFQGGIHGGFRALSGLPKSEISLVCRSCHDGSYTSPQGVVAPEAAVHQNAHPSDPTRDEFGAFKAECLDCHHIHHFQDSLIAGDAGTRTKTLSVPPDVDVDENHNVYVATNSFYLDETSVTAATIVIADDQGTPYVLDTDYGVTAEYDRSLIDILAGGAIESAAAAADPDPITVFAAYEYGANRQLLGVEVLERNSTDRLGRIRQPIIDPGPDLTLGNEDDFQTGWECDSGIPDDPTCLPDQVRELVFYGDLYEGAPWDSNFQRNMWANDVGPYNGACNSCHTRPGNHRRDGTADQAHNIDKNGCVACHTHSSGWINKGG